MKIFKGLACFFFSLLLLGSCFDPPEFPSVPEIEFDKIEFVDDQTDSLILYINFRDGDGDLGINSEDLDFISYPYNNSFFFQENNGSIDTLHTSAAASSTAQYDILDIPNPQNGNLVFPRTRKKPEYNFLPAFNCSDYQFTGDRKLLVQQADTAALDKSVRFTDTLRADDGQGNIIFFYQIQDTLMVMPNPDHFNIEIDFLVKNGQDFEEFDWRKEFCTQSYDGRFPELVDDPGGGLEGTLRYSMNSIGFTNIFSIKTLKLRIQIKDRALNRSNIIETPEFTLDKIRK